jgi:branched-chain amino acid transport system substrate-binding protein
MRLYRRTLLSAAIGSSLLLPGSGRAQAASLRIGVLNDMSGNYRDTNGPTSVACVRQAIEDSGLAGQGITVDVLSGDHQNKGDVGSAIARQWLDQDGVDVIVDVPVTSVAMAVNDLVRDHNKVYLNSSGATADLTGSGCSPNTVKWTYDTYMLAKSCGTATVRAGGNRWFFIAADYSFGHQLQRDATRFVLEAGGTVLGGVNYPFPQTSDFSAYLLEAQASGANVIAFANAGDDFINCLKQADEFGFTKTGLRLVALVGTITGVHAIGLSLTQGLLLTESFYWDLNDRTRSFMARLKPKVSLYPNMAQAGCYSSVLHYLKTVRTMGVAAARADGAAVVRQMKATQADDDAFGPVTIRADGRALCPAYLFQVKRPDESRGEWDVYKLVSTMSGEDGAVPPAEAKCVMTRS